MKARFLFLLAAFAATFAVQAQTNAVAAAAGTNVEVHGYLLVDSSNNYTLAVTNISQISSDN